MTRITANGISVEVEDTGRGEPLLLIMGLGAQLVHWPDGLVDALIARGFRVIRFDNRDMGGSQRLDGRVDDFRKLILQRFSGQPVRSPYTLSDMADDAAGVLDALGLAKAHVLGMSMGGMIGQTLALHHPHRVRSLASIMSSTGARRSLLARPRAITAMFKPAPRSRAEAQDAEERIFKAIGGRGRFAPDVPLIREIAGRAWDRGPSPGGFLRQLAAIFASGDRGPALRFVRAPTTVLHGAVDSLIPAVGGRLTAAAIPGAELSVIDDLGHDLPPASWPLVVGAVTRNAARA